ncbi:MAG: isoprenyl transferase [Candidatus Edwardsbacteria bacterium]
MGKQKVINWKGKEYIFSEERMPQHIAIIMDGNGRWAQKRGLPRIIGHRKGMKTVREIVKACGELDIEVLTLYAFSIENWQRPQREVSQLMKMLVEYLKKERKELDQNNVRLRAIGRLTDLSLEAQELLKETIAYTSKNSGLILNLALSYGGRVEIIEAIQKLMADFSAGRILKENIDEKTFTQYLYAPDLPEPDLLIRTSGEMRISNFLLWQVAYTEIWVTETLWPDFGRRHLYEAILGYQKRERRFGRV